MIRSMTGYGRAAFTVEGADFEAEIRSGNHRYLDLRVRLPRALARFEPEVRALVRNRVGRGRVEVTVTPASGTAALETVEVDLVAAERYQHAAEELRQRHGVPGTLDAGTLLRLPGVARLLGRAWPAETVVTALRKGLEEALAALATMRQEEGAALLQEFQQRLGRIGILLGELGGGAGRVADAVRDRLRKRAEELRRETGLLDEARLHQEIVYAADRLDVTEELVRLRSHVEQFRRVLAESGSESPAGRRLDFLLQEMGREANTIGSKGADASLAHLVVELKTELERLREQVQNVE